MAARILILLLTLTLFHPAPQGRQAVDEPVPPERVFLPLVTKSIPRVTGCTLLAQSPADETTVQAGTDFTVSWILLNTGNIPWNIDISAVRFILGDAMNPGSPVFELPYDVNPGDTLNFAITLRAPSDGGIYTTNWAVVEEGEILCPFSAHIHVPKTPW